MNNLRFVASILVALSFIFSEMFVLGAEDTDTDLSAKISNAPVFFQQLFWTGHQPPEASENRELWAEVQSIMHEGLATNVPALEQFLAEHQDSPWAASIHANLGRYYREHGLYTHALRHWESAWAATRAEKSGAAKLVADFTFAYWTKLLASLGRVDDLTALFAETQGRTFDGGPLQQIINSTKEGYQMMRSDPGVCFKCGTFALMNLARELNMSQFPYEAIDRAPSPTNGFTMTKILQLGRENGLDLVAAEWDGAKTPVVPSIVHWKENHYAAILKQRDTAYLVMDPTFGRPQWLQGIDIAEEASGYFVLPADKVPRDWRRLDLAQTDHIFGRGYDTGIDDENDGPENGSGGCNTDSAGDSSDGGSASTCSGCQGNGSGDSACSDCPGTDDSGGGVDDSDAEGMPVWTVSEPYISLWLHDEPLGYQPGLGYRVSFKISYKQREDRTIITNIFGLGQMWDSRWLSYVIDVSAGGGSTPPQATMIVPGGGTRAYIDDNATFDFLSHTLMQRTADGSGRLTGFITTHANGAKDYYQFVPQTVQPNGQKIAFLTSKTDPAGHSIQFQYKEANQTVKLLYVIDTDGGTNTVTYTNTSFPSQITGVQDPFGRTTTLKYDSNGRLTNVTDVGGISSSFQYDSQGWVTNLTTPYGSTIFQHYVNGSCSTNCCNAEFGCYSWNYVTNYGDPFLPIRAIKIIDPIGGTNLYMLRQDTTRCYTNQSDFFTNSANYMTFLSNSFPGSVIPTGLPPNSPYLDASNYMEYRNSFHWGPVQASGRPVDYTTFTPSDYSYARLRHWLHTSGTEYISQILSLQQDPSPDGVTPGQTTWYDYDGKTAAYYTGPDSQPSLIARVIPDATTWYTWYRRDQWGRSTNVVSTYSMGYGVSPLTRTNVYVYDANAVNLIQVIGPKGETLAGYGYDTTNQLTSVTNAAGDVTSYAYDAQGRRIKKISPTLLTTIYSYFSSGSNTNWVQTKIDLEINRTNSYTYNNDLVATHTDERGVITTNIYDNLHHLTNSSDGRGTITYLYKNLDLIQKIDRLGFTNSYGYDALRHLTAVTNALGYYTINNYCTCGALQSIQDAMGNYTYVYYDNAGRRQEVLYPDNLTVIYNYNLLGQITNVVDASQPNSTNWYNNQGRLYAVSNAFGAATALTFDLEDRPTNTLDANGISLTNAFDRLGRLLSRTYPDGGSEQFGYSAAGLVAYNNQLNFTNYYAYDKAGHKTFQTNANWELTQFQYDASGNLTNLIDGNGHKTSWNYDQYSRVTSKIDNAGNTLFAYQYDADNRLITRTNATAAGILFYYDKVANLTNVVYTHNHGITNTFDALNRVTNIVDGVGTTVYSFNKVGRLLSEDGPWSDDTVSYTYNNRLLAGLSLLAPNASAWGQTYGYDAANRLKSLSSPAGSFSYSYDAGRHLQVNNVSLPNASYITNTFDSVARMLSTSLKNSGNTVLNSHGYAYDLAGERTGLTNTMGDYRSYTYDSIGQLKTALGVESGGPTNRWQEQFGYAYDTAGNLSWRTNNALIQAFNVNGLNELSNGTDSGTMTVAGTTTGPATNVIVWGTSLSSTSAVRYADSTWILANVSRPNGLATYNAAGYDNLGRTDTNTVNVYLPNAVTYGYDLNGNLTNDGLRSFSYDDENQLISVVVTNQSGVSTRSDFSYDGKMRRRIRIEYTWSGGSWQTNQIVRYVYDRNLPIQERDGNNVPLISYTYGKDLGGALQSAGGIGGLLARTDHTLLTIGNAGAHSFYHSDANGNITALENSDQILVAKYLYDPFGSILSQSGPLGAANTYRFSGKEFHANSGLSYYLCRFYDPGIQRWINRDPIGEAGGINLYRFVGNNPVSLIDPDGLTWSSNWNYFWSWVFGTGDKTRNYGPNTTETQELLNSPGGQKMRDNFYKNGCKGFKGGQLGVYGTVEAYWDTIFNPFTASWSGTGAEVGGFAGASAVNNGDGTVTFTIQNDSGTHSFFLHLVPNVPDQINIPFIGPINTPGRTINQTFQWTEPIDTVKCKCSNKRGMGS